MNQLELMISFDKFYGGQSFTSITSKEQILTFLNHRYDRNNGRWIEREHDEEGRYIETWNRYRGLIITFFRWLTNRSRPDDEWETPPFLKIKAKKPLRDSPYDINDIWEVDEMLEIVQYEPELRNQAIITLSWDVNGRPHEITALKLKHVKLGERYGEAVIPPNTKTGGGAILLTTSFPYIRDWINKHPLKNEPGARLICNLINGKPVRPEVINQVMDQLQSRIKRLVESGSLSVHQRQKLEFLLRTKKWNPYCFRHSSISHDSDILPEYALKKKVRWSMDTKQGNRYIKHKIGYDTKAKILESYGIEITDRQPQSVSTPCPRCRYVNRSESKFCEGSGCNYPLTQLALDEIKSAEQAQVQELINQSNKERDEQIQTLMTQVSQLMTDRQNYIDDYNWEKGWVPGGKPQHSQPIMIHDGSTGRISRLAIDALMDQPEWPEGDGRKMTKEDKRELEDMRSNYKE